MQESVKIDRHLYIGGSDIPIIMNLSSFKTRFQLLKEKAQLEEDDFEGNKYTEYGNTLEPKIREYINDDDKFYFVEGRHYDEANGYRIHTDGEDEVNETVLEIKTTSNIHDHLYEYKVYLVQLLFYMKILGYDNGILAVYDRPDDMDETFDPKRLQVYSVFLNEHKGLLEEIDDAITRFRADLQKLKEDPFMEEKDLLPTDIQLLTKRYLELKQREELFQPLIEERKMVEKVLGEMLDENKTKTFNAYGYKFTRTAPAPEKTVMKFDEKAFKEDDPETYEKYSKETKQSARAGSIRVTKEKADE